MMIKQVIRRILRWSRATSAIRRIDVLFAWGIMILVFLVGLNTIQNASDHALEVAVSAEKKARISQELAKEKVCSETNQGEACRDLFQRLRNNISNTQRFQLACVILDQTQQTDIFKKIGCPPVPPAAKP